MLGKTGKFAKTGKLIVTVVAVASDPTGIAATGATLDAYLHLHEKLKSNNPKLANLARELDRDLQNRLKTPDFHCPREANKILPQMIEAALLGSSDFTECGLDADLILERLVNSLTSPDHTKPEMIAAFRALYGPALHTACNDSRLKQALDPALIREQMRQQRDQGKMLKQLLDRTGGIEEALRDAESTSLKDLNLIAARFGAVDFTDKAPLLEFLNEKAEDYRTLRQEVQTFKGLSARIDNIHGAAIDAIDALDFDTATVLIQNARDIHQDAVLRPALETNARLTEKEAQIALLRGRADDAYTLFTAAADSFASVDPVEPARRRGAYADQLYAHSLRYSGPGLALAAQMNRDALDKIPKTIGAVLDT